MTDNLLQKLEEKMIMLLTELDVLRREAEKLKQENTMLRTQHADHARKLQGIISLLDSMDTSIPSILPPELSSKSRDELVAYDS